MGLDIYYDLPRLLAEVGGLQDRSWILDKKNVIFSYIVTKGASYRDPAERFAHSLELSIKYFREVIDSLTAVYRTVVLLL